MGVLWFTDALSAFLFDRKILRLAVHTAFVALLAVGTWFPARAIADNLNYNEQLSLFHSGLVVSINGEPVGTSSFHPHSAVLGTSDAKPAPVLKNKSAFPFVSADAYIIVDNGSKKVLSENNANRPFAPASTTKLMTALAAREVFTEQELVSIPAQCTEIESSKLWLPVDAEFTFTDLLYGLLVSSAGDVGCAIANSKIPFDTFIELMNTKAARNRDGEHKLYKPSWSGRG